MNKYDDQSLYSKGLDFFKNNKLDQALELFKKIENKNINSLNILSKICIKKNEIKNAKNYLNKILNLDKENLFALNSLGDVYKMEKNFRKAEEYYLYSISCNEKFAQGYFNLAILYEEKGDLSLAKNNYFKVIEIDDNNFAAYFNLQRLNSDLITEKIIKKIEKKLKNHSNTKNKNLAYAHFILA